MDSEPETLNHAVRQAEAQRRQLDQFSSSTSSEFQETLLSAIKNYEEALRLTAQLHLFSSNETVDDISDGDLKYLHLDYYLAELILKRTGNDRKNVLLQAQRHYECFLRLLDSYRILSKSDEKLLETYTEDPKTFSTTAIASGPNRRTAKIARFKREKELKATLEVQQKRRLAQFIMAHIKQEKRQFATQIEFEEDVALRNLEIEELTLHVHKTFDALDSIAQELQILDMAPPAPSTLPGSQEDSRRRNDHADGYSERLDGPLTQLSGRHGPILDASGKPLRPFTLLDKRTQFQQGVFRPDHSLPTMTIDEYLEEERRRGGIIEGGGAQSGVREEVDEDDMDKADEATMKARAWDEFKEANPRGSGNTINRG